MARPQVESSCSARSGHTSRCASRRPQGSAFPHKILQKIPRKTMGILTDILGDHQEEFWMHLFVALTVGVCVALFTTYMQQDRIVQTQKQQQARIESLASQQERQREALQSIRELTEGMGVKLDLLLRAQGIEIAPQQNRTFIQRDTSYANE